MSKALPKLPWSQIISVAIDLVRRKFMAESPEVRTRIERIRLAFLIAKDRGDIKPSNYTAQLEREIMGAIIEASTQTSPESKHHLS